MLGNFIGTDKTGVADLGNTLSGVVISDGAGNNLVGGVTASARNVISGNNASGVVIRGFGTFGNRVQGNRIGLAAASSAALANGNYGVVVVTQASKNRIGGKAPGAGNVIAHNAFDGVLINSGNGNAILRNRIFANGGLGIDIGTNGVTPNDLDDADSGPNDYQNFPLLTTAKLTLGGLQIQGSINTGVGKTLRIEFFSSPTDDGTGFGEGRRFLGTITVQTSAQNTISFSTKLAVTGVSLGDVITATVTDELDNTSEFSLAIAVA